MRPLAKYIGLLSIMSVAACASILGDFESGDAGPDANGPDGATSNDTGAPDHATGNDAGTADGTVSDDGGGADVTATDSGTDAPSASGDSGGADVTAVTDSGTDATSSMDDAGGADAEPSDDSPADAPADQGSDGNPCNGTPTTAFYVDAKNGSDTNSGAAPSCPLQTITAALAASAGSASVNATIYLAVGTYAAGETFPLIVNQGRSLVGAGAGTTIQGSSAGYNTSGTKSFLDVNGPYFMTMIAGDVIGGPAGYGKTTLSGFALLPAASVTTPTADYIGLACIEGNAPNTGATPPLPPPNLFVQNLAIGPNYDTGFEIGSSPAQQVACNVDVLGSTFTGMNVALTTGACGTVNPVMAWPSAQIGDGVHSDANTFSASTIDIYGNGCGSAQSINTNNFSSGYRGVVLNSQPAQYFEVLGNSFQGGSTSFPMGVGVQTSTGATLNKMNGNTFVNIAETAGADTAAGGVGKTGFAVIAGSVLQAHQNVIHDNDNGVEVFLSPAASFDFSADATPSNANEIYCNAKPPGASGSGYDLLLTYANGISANFQGNYWDHSPPTTGASLTTTVNGFDVVTGTSGGATLTGSIAIGAGACASGRVH